MFAAVKDSDAAHAAVPRLFASMEIAFTPETFRGHAVMTSDGTSYALLDDLLVVANTPDGLRASLEADARRRSVPGRLAGLHGRHAARLRAITWRPCTWTCREWSALTRGDSSEDSAPRPWRSRRRPTACTSGHGPLHAAGRQRRGARRLLARRGASTLADWMPRTTSAEVVLFGGGPELRGPRGEPAGRHGLRPRGRCAEPAPRRSPLSGWGSTSTATCSRSSMAKGRWRCRASKPGGFHGQILLRPSGCGRCPGGPRSDAILAGRSRIEGDH